MATAQRVVADLQQLPRFEDGWTFLYAEKVRVERDGYAIALSDAQGSVPVPAASLSVLLLGPGATITHAAVLALAESGCSIVWCGEYATRFYASGLGETRKAGNLMAQAEQWARASKRLEVVKRMYRMRFPAGLPDDLGIEQLRGHEGVRVRDADAAASRATGVPWTGRAYQRGDWASADPVNRALSTANACLYGVCHAAIASTGFSPALGFIHTGKALSFVYDVAIFYKADVTVPIAFRVAASPDGAVEARARKMVREAFTRARLLERIVPDIQRCLGLRPEPVRVLRFERDESTNDGQPATELASDPDPGGLWDPTQGEVAGGRNFGDAYEDPAATDEGPAGGEVPF